MKRLLKLLKKPKSFAGFTLIELLVAMAITTIVIGITGWGVVAITQKSKEQKLETDRRVELNRALDFIADEVRQAKPIATDASANLSTIAPGFDATDKTPVLTLQIPDVKQRVIYYIASPSSTSVWSGPKVIYRWGPHFSNNGSYTDANNVPPSACNTYSACNPQGWEYEPLVDLVADSTPSSNPNCDTNWTPNPAVASRTGFYTCVDPSGKIADIHLRGKLVGAYGDSKPAFEVSTKVFARPYNPSFALNTGSSDSGGNGGTITITQPSTMYIEVLGGDIYCGSQRVDTTTTINVTPQGGNTDRTRILDSSTTSLNLSAAVGTKLTFTGTSSPILRNTVPTCLSGFSGYSFDSETKNGTQVLTLRNGDSVPNFPPLSGQGTIDSFLTKYLDPVSRKVKLAENQVIFLYELGVPYNSSLAINNQGTSAFDMQDLVVLATIAPNQ